VEEALPALPTDHRSQDRIEHVVEPLADGSARMSRNMMPSAT
jgi:hypothetical protein